MSTRRLLSGARLEQGLEHGEHYGAGPESFSMGKVRSQRVLISSRCETQDRGTALPCRVLAVHNRVLLKNLFFLSVHFKGLGFCRL